MFHTCFPSPTDQKCAESSTYWQSYYYCPPDKFRYTAGEITKMWCQELDMYLLYIKRYDPLNNRYRFYTSVQLRLIAPLFTVSFQCLKKKMFFKIIKSWQVCDWLPKWLIMFGFINLRRPRVNRRSDIGLVMYIFFHRPRWVISCKFNFIIFPTVCSFLASLSLYFSCQMPWSLSTHLQIGTQDAFTQYERLYTSDISVYPRP